MIPLVMLISVLSLAFAVYRAREVPAADEGTPQMQEIAGAIKEGAEAFLRRQNATIFGIGLGVAALIFVLYAFVRPPNPNDPASPFNMAVATTLAFCFGALCSGVSGYVGMFVSIRANLRTASAVRSSLNRALQLALRGGAVSGLFVVAMSLLGVGGHFAAGLPGVMLFPLVARAFGLIASIVGVMAVRTGENEDPMRALNRGYYIAAGLALLGFGVATRWLLNAPERPLAWLHFFACGLVGIATSQAFVYITQYYTEYRYRPVREIAAAAQTGPATTIITGMSVALECTAVPTIVISLAILSSYLLGRSTGIPGAGLFGTAVATMGMLATAAYILAMDTFGPITDNAGGIVEMSHQPEDVRKKTDRLDAVGNTTKALTKGYAIGSAALAAFLLFSAYLDEVRNYGFPITSVDIARPEIWVGGLLGAMLVFLFSALAIRAVSKAAFSVINDVRAQFKEKPGILAGKERPAYRRCVDIVTRGALREMVLPGVLAVGMPIVTGILFRVTFHVGAEAVAALLMVGTMSGILMATLLNHGGGAWDNAKKYIAMGHYGGKGSPAHKAAVIGDTVGDPFKDTAGPSIHVLIKLLSTITLVMAPLFI